MAIRRILTIDIPADLAILKTVAKPVESVTDETRALMDDMLETMYDAPGIGLAAPQIGVLDRVVVMDLGDGIVPEGLEGEEAEKAARNPRYFVNPEVLWASEETQPYEEGCLSVPSYYDEVQRPARVRVSYLNYQGEKIEEEIDGLYAVCFQHELDHLNGVLFIDHLSRLRRDRAVTKVKKHQRMAA
ncbi:peptide deformylase [uncultured Brevundimonas sp.]|uniref:peptide deformylase n=1 Tax=uncultured Brevundimonas sp. TaxID=213418 RepID=UPI0026281FE0|nr:peptide deformylase [uncultured Brevundimonas sp.]